MMNFFRWLKNHARYWGESYIALPVVLLALLASIAIVGWLTGRAVMEDAGALVGWLLQAFAICVVVSLVGLTQHFLFGYRGISPKPLLADDIHDSCVTCFLLLLFSVLIFGLIR